MHRVNFKVLYLSVFVVKRCMSCVIMSFEINILFNRFSILCIILVFNRCCKINSSENEVAQPKWLNFVQKKKRNILSSVEYSNSEKYLLEELLWKCSDVPNKIVLNVSLSK